MKKLIYLWIGFSFSLASPLSGADDATALFTAQPALHQSQLTGFTRARAQLDVVSELSGRCVTVNSDVGDTIPASGILACLDDTFIRLEIEANQVEQQRLKSDLQFLEKEVSRLQQLSRNKAVSEAELDRMNNQLSSTEFQLKAHGIEARRLQEQLSRVCLKAPAGWKVIQRNLEPKQWVNQGQSVAQVGDFSQLHVPFALTVEEYNVLQHTPSLSVYLPDLRQTVKAEMARISPEFDPQTRKMSVELRLDQGIEEKRGGWRVELALAIPDPSDTVIVPLTAIQTRYEEFFLLTPEGERKTIVKLGQGHEANTMRVQGRSIKAGDTFRLHAIGR
jgi:membrane fusion protein, multidrug efflux system